MLKISNIKKMYPDFLLDVSLCLEPGKIYGLLGPNGSGKTTLFKILLSLIYCDEGSISFNGQKMPFSQKEAFDQIGFCLSDLGFIEGMNLKELQSFLKNTYKNFDTQAYQTLTDTFEFNMKKPISSFSQGTKAKVRVLIALCHPSKLLILDEPMNGLDVLSRSKICALLQEYMEQDEERILLISSHISADLEKLCDELIFIQKGKIQLQTDLDTLLEEYQIIQSAPDILDQIDPKQILARQDKAYYSKALIHGPLKPQFKEQVQSEKCSIDEMLILLNQKEK